MPVLGPFGSSKEGTPSSNSSGNNNRGMMSTAPQPVKVHNQNGKPPPMSSENAGINGKATTNTNTAPFYTSIFNLNRHKNRPRAEAHMTHSVPPNYADDDLDGVENLRNGNRNSQPVSKPPTTHSITLLRSKNGSVNEPTPRRSNTENEKLSFFQRLTGRKTTPAGISRSQPSSPATSRRHFFSFGGPNAGERAASAAAREDDIEVVNERVQTKPNLSFAQRIKLHKGMRTTGRVPFELLQSSKSQQQLATDRKKSKKERGKNKAFSADAINQLDPVYLTEALLAIGDVQPIVARSTPKHSVIITDRQKTEERLRRDCLYEDEFYDKMLSDSLLVCDMLQSHLSDCIAGVRAKSPTALSSPFTSPPQTPNMSRSQSSHSQPMFVGERRSVLPASPIPHRVTISVSPGNGHVGTGRSISTVGSAGQIMDVAAAASGGRSISTSGGGSVGIGYGWKEGALGQFPLSPPANRIGLRSAALSVSQNAASLPPLSPAMSASARKKLSTNVHFAR